jgi:hypothetical protein
MQFFRRLRHEMTALKSNTKRLANVLNCYTTGFSETSWKEPCPKESVASPYTEAL